MGVDAVTEGGKELKEGAEKQKESAKAENAKQTLKGNKNIDTPNKGILESAGEYIQETAESIGSFFGATTKETEHKLKEKKHEAERKAYQEQAKNDNASLGDRLSAGVDVVTEGAKELKEGAAKQYHSNKAEAAKERIKH